MVERTISVHQDLRTMAFNLFKLRHQPFEMAWWQGEERVQMRLTDVAMS